MASDRPILAGRVDEDTHDRWHSFSDSHGVDVAALLEAIGRQLPAPGERTAAWLRQAVDAARAIRAERKDRRPKD